MIIDLSKLPKIKNLLSALEWLTKTYGPQGDRWQLKNLSYIEFRKNRDADLFLLIWK